MVIIDDFSKPGDGSYFFAPGSSAWGNSANPNFKKEMSAPTSSVAGGERDLLVYVPNGWLPFAAAGYMSNPHGFYLATFGAEGTILKLQYDGADDDPDGHNGNLSDGMGLGGLDLTSGGTNSMFLFTFSSLDAGNEDKLHLAATVKGTDGSVAEYVGYLDECVTEESRRVLFDDFTASSGTVDGALSSAASILFTINDHPDSGPVPNIDFGLESIVATVPEPSAAALSIMGFLALAGWMTRRRRP